MHTSPVTIAQYKGHPVICLPVGDSQTFRFGLRKAQAVLQHRDAVQQFAATGAADSPARVESFKDQPILALPLDGESEFRFGQAKAAAIIAHLDAVRAFVVQGGDFRPDHDIEDRSAAPDRSPAEPKPTQAARRAAAFRKLADGMQRQIAEARRPAFEGMRSTRRRERFRAEKEQEARLLERIQDKLRALAEAWEQDTVPDGLRSLTTKAQVERLVRYANYLQGVVNADHLASLVEDSQGRRDTADARRVVQGILRRRERWFARLYGLEEVQAIECLLKAVPNAPYARHLRGSYQAYVSLLKGGIHDAPGYEQARKDLLALGNPCAGQKTAADLIAEAERSLVGLRLPGFFPTTAPVVARMLALAEVEADHRVLEPSAGKGDIAEGVRAACPDARLDVCEIQSRLRAILALKRHAIVAEDCLEYAPGAVYDRVLMNPPFEQCQDIAHVRHAYGLLKPGGRLVAVMSEGVFFRQGRTERAFRDWLDDLGGASERLPEGSFQASGTGVAARLVVLEKPAEYQPAEEAESPVLTYTQLALF